MMTDVEQEPSGLVIGIDLGTTYSCVSCFNKTSQKVEVIPTASGRTMPSWVGFSAQSGKVLVGSAAKNQASSNATNTVYDVKRILGRSFSDSVTQEEMKQFPFSVTRGKHDEPLITVQWLGGETKQLSPEQISAMILSELRHEAERYLKTKIKDAVITVPAHFNNQQRQATKDAGRIAGLNVRRVINEPTAAALAYGLHNDTSSSEKGNNIIIFDLGGGTFDVTCLTMNEGVLEVMATGGDTHLGGEDFDHSVMTWCFQQIKQQHPSVDVDALRQDNRAMSRLKQAVESAKRTLSSSLSVDIEVDSLLPNNVDFEVSLSRTVFEEINADLFQKCLDTVKSVLVDAQVEMDQVTNVVLVGGSTRVPFLQSALFDMFDQRIQLSKTLHPDEAVSIGAAVQGHILATGGSGGGQDLMQQQSQDLLLLDVTPLSLGIELEGRTMSTLIKRNTPIPCKKTRTYTTVEHYQQSIDVVVYEGERPSIDANNKLGSFVISGIQRAPAGEPKVDVTFSLDANGILNVSAQDQVTGAQAQATIKAEKGRLSEDDIDRMIAEAERYRAQDAELAKKAAYKTAMEEALLSAQSTSACDDEDKMMELEELMDWLELDSEDATLEEMKNRGHALENKFGVVISRD